MYPESCHAGFGAAGRPKVQPDCDAISCSCAKQVVEPRALPGATELWWNPGRCLVPQELLYSHSFVPEAGGLANGTWLCWESCISPGSYQCCQASTADQRGVALRSLCSSPVGLRHAASSSGTSTVASTDALIPVQSNVGTQFCSNHTLLP